MSEQQYVDILFRIPLEYSGEVVDAICAMFPQQTAEYTQAQKNSFAKTKLIEHVRGEVKKAVVRYRQLQAQSVPSDIVVEG